MDKKILQVTSADGKTIHVFGAECIYSAHDGGSAALSQTAISPIMAHSEYDGGYFAEAWDRQGKIVATTRVYSRPETAWKNLRARLARKYAED